MVTHLCNLQQQPQPGQGALVPYGVGMYGQPMYGQQPGYGYGYQQPQYGQQAYGMGGPVQPGALVPYGLSAGGALPCATYALMCHSWVWHGLLHTID